MAKGVTATKIVDRMGRIQRILEKNRVVTAGDLAEKLGTCRKTIYRTIEFMRDQGHPIVFDRDDNSFRYDGVVSALPPVVASDQEFASLRAAEAALAQSPGNPHLKPLRTLIEKLDAAGREAHTTRISSIPAPLSFKTVGSVKFDPEVFQAIERAQLDSSTIYFEYRKAGSQVWENRHAEPYAIVNAENGWYVVAFDRDRQDMRLFAIPRMRKVRSSGLTFAVPADFTPEAHFKDTWGIYTGSETRDVCVRFDSFAAVYVQEREWHPSQRIRHLREGGIELRLSLASLYEFERWVLGWGDHAEVLAPEESRERIRVVADNLQHKYGSEEPSEHHSP